MSEEYHFDLDKSNRVDITFEYENPTTLGITFESGEKSQRLVISPENNGWRKAEEELPHAGLLVLCLDKYGFYHIAWHSDESQSWHDMDQTLCLDIVYWMPIPDLPKES